MTDHVRPPHPAARAASDLIVGTVTLTAIGGMVVVALAFGAVLLLFGVFVVAMIAEAFQSGPTAGMAAIGGVIGCCSLLLLALSVVLRFGKRLRGPAIEATPGLREAERRR